MARSERAALVPAHARGMASPPPSSPMRPHTPALPLRTAAFLLQLPVPVLQRLLTREATDPPGLAWHGGRRVVPVSVVEDLLAQRGEHGSLPAGEALALLIAGKATVPVFPTRNGPPPPLSALVLASVAEASSCAHRSAS